jgi:hypothetical protein
LRLLNFSINSAISKGLDEFGVLYRKKRHAIALPDGSAWWKAAGIGNPMP